MQIYKRPDNEQIKRAVELHNQGKPWWQISREVFGFNLGLLRDDDIIKIEKEQNRIGAVVR